MIKKMGLDRRILLFLTGSTLMFFTFSYISVTASDFFIYAFALGFFLGVPPVLSWISQILDFIEERKSKVVVSYNFNPEKDFLIDSPAAGFEPTSPCGR